MRNRINVVCTLLLLSLFSPGMQRATAAPFANSSEYRSMEGYRTAKDQQKRVQAIESYFRRVSPKVTAANASLYAGYIERYAQQYKVDPFLVAAILVKESTVKANAVSKGNYGLMQINWKANGPWIRRTFSISDKNQVLSPENNIRIGTCIIASKIRDARGDVDKALDRYRGRSLLSYRNGVMKHYQAIYSLFSRR